MGSRFMSIAEQMGAVLRNTAVSTNIKERLDYSCAVFDREGGIVANAPHIPVHLGAMGATVRAVKRKIPDLRAGDAIVSNDPAEGGSHLPDVTVVTPVFEDGALRFFVASRGHQADLGGITPGSMPADSRTLEEEGVVLSAFPIVRDGRFDEARVRALLAGARWPARNPDDNVADLEAMIAANRAGEKLLASSWRSRASRPSTRHGASCSSRRAPRSRARSRGSARASTPSRTSSTTARPCAFGSRSRAIACASTSAAPAPPWRAT